jgi:hypothetical protein
VKRERLAFLADSPFYTKRFAHYVGRRCRSTTIKDPIAAQRASLPSRSQAASNESVAESPYGHCSAAKRPQA